MATTALTAESFESTVLDNDIVFVDFWASWFGPCRMFGPVLEAVSEANPDITFGKVDTEAQRSLAASARITSIPTLMAFREGVLVFSQPGALVAAGLSELITAVRDLDMDHVHQQIAEQAATATTSQQSVSS